MPQRAAEAPSAELIAAAEQAKLTGQIRGFLSWLGEGRRLTQTGRIGLADARRLVELLDTGDIADERIGNRVFRTRSSAELGNLTLIADWVKAASLARPVHGKLVPVQKNAKLAGKPLDLVMALLSAYPKLGKFLFPSDCGGRVCQQLTVPGQPGRTEHAGVPDGASTCPGDTGFRHPQVRPRCRNIGRHSRRSRL